MVKEIEQVHLNAPGPRFRDAKEPGVYRQQLLPCGEKRARALVSGDREDVTCEPCLAVE